MKSVLSEEWFHSTIIDFTNYINVKRKAAPVSALVSEELLLANEMVLRARVRFCIYTKINKEWSKVSKTENKPKHHNNWVNMVQAEDFKLISDILRCTMWEAKTV